MLLNLVVPPLGLVFLLLTWPAVACLSFWRWVFSYALAENVRGKVAVITGPSSGIGEYMAYEYGKRGAKVVLIGRRENQLKNVQERVRSERATDTLVVVADVSREEECKKVVDVTINTLGKRSPCLQSWYCEQLLLRGSEKFGEIMDVNFMGCVYTTYFALPHLRKSRGKIVVTASTASWLPIPRMSMYNASKAAVVNFFDTLRTEERSDIGGMTIAMPGYIHSEMTMGKFMSAEGKQYMNVDIRDTLVGPSPVASTQYCAKQIVSAATRGERYVVVPAWYKVSPLFRVFVPQLLETFISLFFVKELQPGKPVTKVIMDSFPSVERVLYPPGMQQKTD
ncbi:11-beta-hydroxysteroid dehydrogenase 1B [Selaginella moellendorffii]|uniref:11-beta-hydroxysteroid dehydrogenase 1B n=1 Tax=Selaginella moellendorffii TaxID=88036 RepID=UPI000D1C791A|nr:11-beta-hydroxysteroid dehydrogenase 1B [Selaginella moellendorffii]|eukprot:XP_024544283.1 11-beta-hydroxysteroid dehydrogenase 1B [Selaginella moellendorffii]